MSFWSDFYIGFLDKVDESNLIEAVEMEFNLTHIKENEPEKKYSDELKNLFYAVCSEKSFSGLGFIHVASDNVERFEYLNEFMPWTKELELDSWSGDFWAFVMGYVFKTITWVYTQPAFKDKGLYENEELGIVVQDAAKIYYKYLSKAEHPHKVAAAVECDFLGNIIGMLD